MNDQDETERTAALLKAALSAAADVMVVRDAPEGQPVERVEDVKRPWGLLLPLAAAAGVVVIALAGVGVAHLTSSSGKRAAGPQEATRTTAQEVPPKFYMTATYAASGPNVLVLQVRRTADGAVTASRSVSAANVGWGGYLTAAAGDRAFLIARYPCTSAAVPQTTFSRVTITGSGQISGIAPAGPRVKGMVTSLAVSPDGSQVAYNALQGVCAGRVRPTAAGSVSVLDLSTGVVRTWPDATGDDAVDRLSWAPEGRTLIVDEQSGWPRKTGLTVLGLDTASSGGSLQARSTTLLQQNLISCSTCVTTALAGPHGSLIALESQGPGPQTRMVIVSISPAAGNPRTVLYREPSGAPTALYADASGRWVLLWPANGLPGPRYQNFVPAGWISGGTLHPLPGVGQVFPQGIAW